MSAGRPNNNNSNNNNKAKAKPKAKHRKTFSAGRLRAKSAAAKVSYASYEQEEEGSTIFHELDPSKFPVSKGEKLWMESSTTDICSICLEKIDSKLFGTKKRHCKKCGRVVCIPCSDIRIRKHRVCEQCNKYYLQLNNILNQWYRTNRNINHSLCGYDSYTLDTCSSLKRILFILNHYHQWLLLQRDGQLSLKREAKVRKYSNDISVVPLESVMSSGRAKVRPPYDITSLSIKQFVDRLPKYDTDKFVNDIHHLKQMHFKKSEVFKISQYQKNHQWEIRAYSWKKIGKCDRLGCQYGIKDVRKKDDGHNKLKVSNGNVNLNDEQKSSATSNGHSKNDSMINLSQDIPTLLNNMHVVLLHGVDDDDEKDNVSHKELYDLLPQTPLSPHIAFFAGNTKRKATEDQGDDFKLEVIADNEHGGGDEVNGAAKNKMTEQQEKLLAIEIRPLSEIEWMDERHQTLCYWLDCCCIRLDFFSTSQHEWEAIQKKKQLLSDILDYLDMTEHIWDDEQILKCIMKMIKSNLFRSLPLTFRMLLATPDYCQEDDSEEFEDPNYPHLCYVYEIALMLVRNINVDDRTRKKYLGKSFIVPLTELFASEDVREREYLKAILHGIYARNMRLRRLIRQQMNNCCYRVIYTDTDDIENGISECLQLVCSIIQGLTTPIKQEYKNILYNVLIPLHKANSRKLHKFHETLLACCIQFILKDLSIGLDILSGLLKYWPFQSAAKSDMFLKEIVIIVNTMMTDIDTVNHQDEEDEDEDEETKRKKREKNLFKFTQRGQVIADEIIDKLVECMISDNHCLSEKALLAFGEIGVQKLIDVNKEKAWRHILHILLDNRDNKRHWCRPLHESFDEALDTFMIRDAKHVQSIESEWKKKHAKENQFKKDYNPIYPDDAVFTLNQSRVHKYKTLQSMAKHNNPSYQPPTQPFARKGTAIAPKKADKPSPTPPSKPLPMNGAV
eukprot:CAMPEP_0197034718 /NCGR_PEP_ID=MMETSP1384-20130603/12730_1 /TAXON_ID=29189 /ORGANISM="Ammonia sp." /LENGTH=955 /DNA_ID=CAMNT_0042464673 /DNA_START=76 /DNA_END=2943 /DNA_ORIENTATION=+